MAAQLVPLDRQLAVPISVGQPIVLVGRHPEVDVRINQPAISRRHCCLAVVYDRVVIRDLGSRHGVFVNGVRVDEAEIRAGDEVAIAHLIFRFEAVQASPTDDSLDFPAPGADLEEDDLVPLDD